MHYSVLLFGATFSLPAYLPLALAAEPPAIGKSTDGRTRFAEGMTCEELERQISSDDPLLDPDKALQAIQTKIDEALNKTKRRIELLKANPEAKKDIAYLTELKKKLVKNLKEPLDNTFPEEAKKLQGCEKKRSWAILYFEKRVKATAQAREWMGGEITAPLESMNLRYSEAGDSSKQAVAKALGSNETKVLDALFELRCHLYNLHKALIEVEDQIGGLLAKARLSSCRGTP